MPKPPPSAIASLTCRTANWYELRQSSKADARITWTQPHHGDTENTEIHGDFSWLPPVLRVSVVKRACEDRHAHTTSADQHSRVSEAPVALFPDTPGDRPRSGDLRRGPVCQLLAQARPAQHHRSDRGESGPASHCRAGRCSGIGAR